MRNGSGQEIKKDYTYEGAFVNDKRHGFGNLKQKLQLPPIYLEYSGNFKND